MTTIDLSTLAGNRYAYFRGAVDSMTAASLNPTHENLMHAWRLIGFTKDAHDAAGETDIIADVLNDLIAHVERRGVTVAPEVRQIIDAEMPAAPVDPAPAAVDVDTESRIVAEKVRREAFGDWSPWTVYPERDERYGWTVTRTRGNERQLFMRSSDDWLVAARIACELNWNEGLRPECIDTGRAHGPSFSELLRASHRAVYAAFSALVFDGDDWTPETEAPYRDVQRRHYALCQHIPSPFTVVEPTPAAIIAAVPHTVIAENDAYQLIAEDGAAFLAAHDRKQALRKAHNELDRWFAAAPLNERQSAFRDAMHAALDRIHAAGASPERIADAAYALKHADCYARLNAVADQYVA